MKIFTSGFLIICLLFSFQRSHADIIIQTIDVTATPGTEFTIPLIIFGAGEEGTPISSANIIFTFDTANVQFLQFQNFNPITPQSQWFFSGNNNTGKVAANWIEPNLLTVALPEGSTLYHVKFKAKPGACPFTFITYEFTDDVYNEIPTTPDHGSFASLQQVLFQVNMRDQAISPDGVHLSGTFNGWSTTETPMTVEDSTIYLVSLQLVSDSVYHYRFVNGITSGGYETVPAECGILNETDYVRSVTIPDNDTTLAPVCFSSCDTCPPQVQVTFRVDMGQQSLNQNGVHIAGTFNNWNPASTLMNNLGNDIFGVSVPLVPGTEVEYRFVNGNTAEGYEVVPSNCGVPAGGGFYNRYLFTPDNDTTLPAICFSNCSECLTLHSVTFKVDMNEQEISQNGIHLAGSFNGFNPNSIQMVNMGNDVFVATLDLFEDDSITYRFVNGDDISGFEIVPPECGLNDGSGVYNRYLTVPDQPIVLPEVCFSSCNDCEQQPWEKEVTFQVDMSLENISTDGVHIAGTFNGWDPVLNGMIHLGNDIYSTTLTLNENEVHQYRFVNGNVAEDFETVPEECGVTGTSGGLERQITVPENDTVIEAVCFAACAPCVIYQVTLRVDMMRESISVFGIHLSGSFNNWNPDDREMVSSGSSVYETTIQVYQGDTLLYRFVNGDQAINMETVPSDCGWLYNSEDYSRLIIPSSDTTLNVVCYSWCDPCDVGLEEETENLFIGNIYPNPAKTYVKIPLTITEPVDVQIYVTDITGKLADYLSVSLSKGYHELTLNTQDFHEGLHVIRFLVSGQRNISMKSEKLLITR